MPRLTSFSRPDISNHCVLAETGPTVPGAVVLVLGKRAALA
jgi:hypothetical protein